MGLLSLQREERVRQGTAGRSTQSLLNQMNVRRRKIRQFLSVWEAWQRFLTTGPGPPVRAEPEDVYVAMYPWEPATTATVVTQDMLHLSMYKAKEELQRSQEELKYLSLDACILIARYEYEIQFLSLFVLKMHGEGKLGSGLAHRVAVKLHEVRVMMHKAHKLFSLRNIY